MTKKISIIAALTLAAMAALTGCKGGGDDPNSTPKPTPTPTMSPELTRLTKNTIEAVITLDDGDEINLELYPDLAPETVENFIELADSGFYDGTIFHRVIEGFVIQGGGYDEDLNELKADTIKGEFTENGFKNELSHMRGVISMARVSNDPDSASSQFFIMQEDTPYLDGQYAAFGRVTDEASLTVIDDIASVRTGTVSALGLDDVPVSPIVIRSIMIDPSSGGTGSRSSAKNKSKNSADDTDIERGENTRATSEPGESSEEMTEEELNEFIDSFGDTGSSGSSGSSGGTGSAGSSGNSGNTGGTGGFGNLGSFGGNV